MGGRSGLSSSVITRTTRPSPPCTAWQPGLKVMGYPSAGPWGWPGGTTGSLGIVLGDPGCEVTILRELSWTRVGPLLQGDTSALSRLCQRWTQGVPARLGRHDCASGSEGDNVSWLLREGGPGPSVSHGNTPPAQSQPPGVSSQEREQREAAPGQLGDPREAPPLCTSLPLAGPGPPREDSFPCGRPCPHLPAHTLPSLPQWKMVMPIPGGGVLQPPPAAPLHLGHLSAPESR